MTVRGVDSAKAELRGIRDRARDLTPVWPGVGDEVADAAGRQFASSGSEFGTPWAPLDPAYAARKKGGGGILVLIGALRASLTGRPMAVEEYGPRSAVFGTDSQVARWHQGGTENMPARPVLRRTERLATAMNRRIARYIVSGTV